MVKDKKQIRSEINKRYYRKTKDKKRQTNKAYYLSHKEDLQKRARLRSAAKRAIQLNSPESV